MVLKAPPKLKLKAPNQLSPQKPIQGFVNVILGVSLFSLLANKLL